MTLTWTAPSNGGAGQPISGFTVQRSTDGSTWTTIVANTGYPNSGIQNTFTDQSVSNGYSYYYRVAALSNLGIGAYSSTVSAAPVGPSSAPANLYSVAGDSNVQLTWSAPVNSGGSPVTGYKIVQCTSATIIGFGPSVCSGTVVTPNTNTTTTSYNVPSLTNGTTYYIGVQALTASTPPQGYIAIVTVVPRALLAAPSALAAAQADRQITLSWSAPSAPSGYPVTGYRVDICSLSSCSDSDFVTLTSNTQSTSASYVVTGLTNGTLYTFRVYAVTAPYSNGSIYGAYATVTGLPGTVSSVPLSLVGVPGDGQVTLSWQPPVNNGGGLPFNYYVEYSTNNSTWLVAPNTNAGVVPSNTTSIVVNGLTNGTGYYFRISAQNSAGSSATTAVVNSRIFPGGLASAPTLATATGGNASVTLTWQAPAITGGGTFINYQVQQLSGSTWSQATGVYTLSSSTYTQIVGGLTNGTAYSFRIAYVSNVGVGTYSYIYVTPMTTSSAVQAIQALVSDSAVTLYWTAPASNGGQSVTGYNVEQSTDGTNYTTIATSIGLPGTTGYTVSGLTNATAYYFRITPLSVAGSGAKAVIQATPAAVPPPPASVSTAVSNQQIVVNWTAPSSTGGLTVSSYNIQYSPDNGTTWLPTIAANVTGSTTYTIATDANNTIVNGTSYQIRVRSLNAVGNSAWLVLSNIVPGTKPLAPTSVTAAPDTSTPTPVPGALNISWIPPASTGVPITRYEVDYATTFATVTSVTVSGTTATYTTSAAHGFTANQLVTVSGMSNTALNIENLTITSTGTNSFVVTLPVTGVASAFSQSGKAAIWNVASANISGSDCEHDVLHPRRGSELNRIRRLWVCACCCNELDCCTYGGISDCTLRHEHHFDHCDFELQHAATCDDSHWSQG